MGEGGNSCLGLRLSSRRTIRSVSVVSDYGQTAGIVPRDAGHALTLLTDQLDDHISQLRTLGQFVHYLVDELVYRLAGQQLGVLLLDAPFVDR